MLRSFCTIVLLLSYSAALQAGLSFTPTSPILPGTTAVFELTIVDPTTTVSTIDTIGPNVVFTVSATTGTGTAPSFTTSGIPTLAGNWAVSIFDPNYLSTNFSPAAPVPATFGQLSVDIPSDFAGGFELVLLNTIEVMSAGPAVDQIVGGVAGAQFSVSAVPEPNACLLLGLVGSGCAGLQYLRRRKCEA